VSAVLPVRVAGLLWATAVAGWASRLEDVASAPAGLFAVAAASWARNALLATNVGAGVWAVAVAGCAASVAPLAAARDALGLSAVAVAG
jgi:hypothetical protein